MNRAMLWILTAAALNGCAGHRLANYDVGVSVGQTEFSGETDTHSATTAIGKINLHFEVAK